MPSHTWLILLAMAGLPSGAGAQSTVSGSAEWTVAQTDNTTDSQANRNGDFWQNYTVGFHSSIIDPRILKYDTEVSFRTNHLSAAGSNLPDQKGRQNDLGFRVGAFALSSGAFPFFIQASRVFSDSSGELMSGNSVLGGMALQTGAPVTAFETEDRNLNLGGQLNIAGLPRAEVSYRRDNSIVTGGTESAEQRNHDLSANVTRETTRTRQALHYQRAGYGYLLGQEFIQKVDNLDYDFTATVLDHVQLNTRAGRRGSFTKSGLLAPPIDLGDKPYQPPPTDGASDTQYVTGGASYDPNTRISVRLNATWDQQHSTIASTNAGLATGMVHAEVVRGLAVNASLTSGHRGEIIDGAVTDVATSNGVAGITYSGGPRWLSGTLTANTGQGTNATPQGERGSTRSWAREASVASSLGWLGLGAGYERVMNTDAVLDYGNYDSERSRVSANLQSARMSVTGSADRTIVKRGQGETFAHNRQDTFSASLSGRLWHEVLVTGQAGGFTTTQLSAVTAGRDRSLFWGVGAQATMRSLRAIAWIRSEDITAITTRYDQQGLSSLARLEYRLRTLNFALEYRHNNSLLQYGSAPEPTLFRGHQIRFSLTRQFGFGV
ncbi:MAG: hypothetical protein ABI665_21520 [Vicinamibacterales bacterium]